MLGAGDRLPARPARVLVSGTSGSGKTTLSAQIARISGAPYREIDSLYWGEQWTPRPSFLADVRTIADAPSWVSEWQYTGARPLLAARANLVVWLDLPFAHTMRRLIARTLRRRLRREVLWNGNREPPLRTVLTNRDHVVRWAWRIHPTIGPRVLELAGDRPDLPIVRLHSAREVAQWVDGPLRAAR